jgi:hypothetical protein
VRARDIVRLLALAVACGETLLTVTASAAIITVT